MHVNFCITLILAIVCCTDEQYVHLHVSSLIVVAIRLLQFLFTSADSLARGLLFETIMLFELIFCD